MNFQGENIIGKKGWVPSLRLCLTFLKTDWRFSVFGVGCVRYVVIER